MTLENDIAKLYAVIPSDERIISVLKYIPIEQYEFSNDIYLIKTLTAQYILKVLDKSHMENNMEKEINVIISQNTSCKVPKIIASDTMWILMEYINGVELSKLIALDVIDLFELEAIAQKLGEYMGELFVKCRLSKYETNPLVKINDLVACSNKFISLLPFNVEIMMFKQNNEWCIKGMLDLELMKYGDVNEYIDFVASSNVIMLPGIKNRTADGSNIINRKYVDTLVHYIKSSD